MILEIENLVTTIGIREIINEVNLSMNKGEFHVIMGPNGCGKSTLLSTIMASPFLKHKSGTIKFNEIDLKEFSTNQRAKMGIFLAFQYPVAIPGLTVGRLMKKISDLHDKKEGAEFVKNLKEKIEYVGLGQSFINRYIGDGFSGGEKKKLEILQILISKPKLIMLDELDSGLDIDSTKTIFKILEDLKKQGTSVLLITHYKEVFKHINPEFIHIMKDGKIIKTGNKTLVEQIDKHGYNFFKDEKNEK